MNPRTPRNACPTLTLPMTTGDGLLARLPPTGRLPAAALRALCDAATRFGNGAIEITARGSLQVRGLSPATAAPFAAALGAAGIRDAAPAILVPPLAGLDPAEQADVRPLAAALREAAAAIGPGLPPKTSVVVDGGGRLHPGAIDADLRLAVRGARVDLALGGDAVAARPAGSVAVTAAVAAACRILALMAEAGVRGRDLDPDVIAAAVGSRPTTDAERHAAAAPVGVHRLAGGRIALGVAPPFGRVDAAVLRALVEAAADLGARSFVPAAPRALLAVGLAAADGDRLRSAAADLGFVIDPGDSRRAVTACAGAPACAAGRLATRAAADAVTTAAAPILDGSVTVHVSGCAKGCAHPRAATLALVGVAGGLALAVDGRAEDAVPVPGEADPATVVRRIATAVAGARRPGETAAAAIARLGPLLVREPADA